MAGGIFDMVKKFSKKRKVWKREDNLVNVFFCGENVTCHSDVLIQRDKNHVENFMKKVFKSLSLFKKRKKLFRNYKFF